MAREYGKKAVLKQKSGKTGKKVTSRKQAVAIGLSETRKRPLRKVNNS